MNTASTSGSGSLASNTIANPKGELNAITTRSGIVLDGPSVSIPPPFINPEEDERVEETLTDQDLAEYTIKVPPPLKMFKALLSNKEKLLELANTPFNENCSAVILKKLPEKLGYLGNFSFCVVSTSWVFPYQPFLGNPSSTAQPMSLVNSPMR
nr:reverse transcriptase domain-containing protein [Tanacetum cinerariifolium]